MVSPVLTIPGCVSLTSRQRAPIQKFWQTNNPELRTALRPTFDFIKPQYVHGAPEPDAIPPETYWLDFALASRPGNADIQVDLFYDYRTNVELVSRAQPKRK